MQGKVPTLPPEVKEPSTSRSQILDDGGGVAEIIFVMGVREDAMPRGAMHSYDYEHVPIYEWWGGAAMVSQLLK